MSDVLTSTPSIQIQGIVHPASYFQIVESNGIDWQLWIDVIQGKVAGAIFRRALSQEVCQQVCHNFWQSPSLTRFQSANHYYDAALGPCMGVIINHPLEVYFEEAEKTSHDVKAVLANTDNFFRSWIDQLKESMAEQGLSLRLPEYNGLKTAEYKLRSTRSWKNPTEQFVLAPHDDIGALQNPRNQNFEVSRLMNARVVAVFVCLENSGGGELHYWNISPDSKTREALGFEYDAMGYPLESLAEFDKTTLSVHAGDIYIFDGTKVHAVAPLNQEGGKRLTLSWVMGMLDAETVLHWA